LDERAAVLSLLRVLAAISVLVPVVACGTRSSGSVHPTTGTVATQANSNPAAEKPTDAIIITENDITDRPYVSLGDISAEVDKWTIFDRDPTREQVNTALREQAAKLGADAVVLVRYGTPGITALSWGALDGKGRAIAFQK
jgi:hypothetical protein